MSEQRISVNRALTLLGVGTTKLYRMCRDGTLKFHEYERKETRKGGCTPGRYFLMKDIEACVMENSLRPTLAFLNRHRVRGPLVGGKSNIK
jgi:hypothetical protein